MTFVVEDGTGLSNANSFVATATAASYWTDRGISTFGQASSAQQQAACIRASDYLKNQKRFVLSGTKITYAQALPWPRSGAIENRGQAVPSNVVPAQYAEACCYLALVSLSDVLAGGAGDLQVALPRGGGVQTKSVSGLSITYFQNANNETVYPFVEGVVATILVKPNLQAVPKFTGASDFGGFLDEEFDGGGNDG